MMWFKEGFLLLAIANVFLGSQLKAEVLVCACLFFIFTSVVEIYKSRIVQAKEVSELRLCIELLSGRVEALLNNVSVSESRIEVLEKAQTAIRAMAEESKKFVSQANLNMGFRATKREG